MELSEFECLLPASARLDQQEQQRKARVVRMGKALQRKPGGGVQYTNSPPDRCLMLLLYYLLYFSQEFLTLLFKTANKSVICRGIQAVRPLWEAVLPLSERVRAFDCR